MIPDHITTRDEAYGWMLRHGYSVDLANEELDVWEADQAPVEEVIQAPVSVEEVAAVVLEPMLEEDDEELYDEDGEEYDEEEYEFEEEDEEEEAEDASDD